MHLNADNILFRASSNGHLMTEPKSKTIYKIDGVEITTQKANKLIEEAIKTENLKVLKGLESFKIESNPNEISEGTKSHLVDKFVSAKYGRNTEIKSKYIAKGLEVEEDSITLYSRATKTFFKKNEITLINDYICGTPDLYQGESIEKADLIIDIKSSWDIFTFWKSKTSPLNKMYYWQGQSYMALTGAKNFKLVYCLIDTPHTIVEDEKRKLAWSMGVIDPNNEDYVAACLEIDKSMIYGDINLNERYFEINIERNDNDIEKLYQRVKDSRQWINENLFNL